MDNSRTTRIGNVTARFRQLFRTRNNRPPTVLCADDDPQLRSLCVTALERAGFATVQATDGREALEKMRTVRFSAILLDLSMPHLHGTTVLSMLRKEQPAILKRLIVLTGAPPAAFADLEGSIFAVLRKPVSLQELIATVSECCLVSVASSAVRTEPVEVTQR